MRYPSVSKILEATMAPHRRATLQAWRDRVGHEEAERIGAAARERGMEIDRRIVAYKDTGQCEDERITAYLTGKEFIAHELSVVSHVHKYQGRFDAVLGIDDTPTLVDFKGSTRWKQYKYLEDYRHQLGAYYGACLEMGIPIQAGCVVLFVDGHTDPQLYRLSRFELSVAHSEFIQRAKQFVDNKSLQ